MFASRPLLAVGAGTHVEREAVVLAAFEPLPCDRAHRGVVGAEGERGHEHLEAEFIAKVFHGGPQACVGRDASSDRDEIASGAFDREPE